MSGTATISRDRAKIRRALRARLEAVVSRRGRPAPRHGRRSAHGADRRHRARGGVPGDEQAAAGAAVRSRERLGHRHRAEAGRDARAARAAPAGGADARRRRSRQRAGDGAGVGCRRTSLFSRRRDLGEADQRRWRPVGQALPAAAPLGRLRAPPVPAAARWRPAAPAPPCSAWRPPPATAEPRRPRDDELGVAVAHRVDDLRRGAAPVRREQRQRIGDGEPRELLRGGGP